MTFETRVHKCDVKEITQAIGTKLQLTLDAQIAVSIGRLTKDDFLQDNGKAKDVSRGGAVLRGRFAKMFRRGPQQRTEILLAGCHAPHGLAAIAQCRQAHVRHLGHQPAVHEAVGAAETAVRAERRRVQIAHPLSRKKNSHEHELYSMKWDSENGEANLNDVVNQRVAERPI